MTPTKNTRHGAGSAGAPPARGGAPGGFTLVEVLVTIAVIAFGCLAALLMQSSALRSNTMSDHMTVATFVAESEIERLKSLTFEELNAEIAERGPLATWWTDRMYRICPGSSAASCTKDYPFEVQLRYYSQYPTTFSNTTEVTVSWRDNTGRHSVHNAAAMTDLSF
ncbi:MAG: prepilin-type N-terminal cleavage/methylation domain-containing protein [Deltaproteobacteria bacterium]|jgi:prepilin-type N-terminal cleavage/methylation domain-containing protein|nr:prepilin-type N-terminal cleavage/methylation domain-containing protein [Deltaproteobacteria bacterium]